MTKEDIQKIIRGHHEPRNLDLYRTSMVHKSYCTRKNQNIETGNVNCPNNCLPLQDESSERLEFLGDAVLNLVIGNYLFERYPDENEGFLTKMRTKLVCGTMLAFLAGKMNISKYFIISRQIEESQDGRLNAKILEDAFESFLGALFLDSNCDITIAKNWTIDIIESFVDFSSLIAARDNPKDEIIKKIQQMYGYIPKFHEFDIKNEDGKKMFHVCLKDTMNKIIARGSGITKKKAEQNCATNALASFA